MQRDSGHSSDEMQIMATHVFAHLGVEDMAYVRKTSVNGTDGWGVFAADGTSIGFAEERDVAFALVRQNDLQPVSVH